MKKHELHGETRKDGSRTLEYVAWSGMRQRCGNPNAVGYARYGGRGIRVCHSWQDSFSVFLRDMGRKPSKKHQLDRINNDGNYEPGNVRWATTTEQSRNRSSNLLLDVFGEIKCVTDWAASVGIGPSALVHRLASGWSLEDAVSVPGRPQEAPKLIPYNGEQWTIPKLARAHGVAAMTLKHRLESGWSIEDALNLSPGAKGVGRKVTKPLTIGGETKSVADWSQEVGVGRTTIYYRLERGWTHEEAVFGKGTRT